MRQRDIPRLFKGIWERDPFQPPETKGGYVTPYTTPEGGAVYVDKELDGSWSLSLWVVGDRKWTKTGDLKELHAHLIAGLLAGEIIED